MSRFSLITAIGTPLDENEEIHIKGLEAEIEDQWSNGITGLLVAGTMGAMQLLSDAAYHQLIDHSIRCSKGCGEVLVGVGDASYARTLQRIAALNKKDVDGAVVLSPYLLKFSQAELVDYFNALADASAHPLYLYDLPGLTGTKLSLDTVRTAAEHPNIRGIKCSGDISWTRTLLDLKIPDFRVIVAQANLVDVLMRCDVREHLDGVFALHPHWISEMAKASEREDWDAATVIQRKVVEILNILVEFGVMPTFSAIMNLRGIPGCYAPKPYRLLDNDKLKAISARPVVQELVERARSMQRKIIVHQ